MHLKNHTRPYICEVCSRRFSQNAELKRHYFSHTGENPFSFEVCSKRFTIKAILKKHYLSHTGEKPFSCEICSKRFALKGNLNIHFSILALIVRNDHLIVMFALKFFLIREL